MNTTITKGQRFLLDWLGKEDSSALGECKGADLDELVSQGLAVIGALPEDPALSDYRRVSLTDAGHVELAALV